MIVIATQGLAVDSKGNPLISMNGGKTWTSLTVSTDFAVFDPIDPRIVYFSQGFSMLKSSNGGLDPKPLSVNFSGYIGGIVVDANIPKTLYILTFNGVYKSIDGGRSMRKMNSGLMMTHDGYLDPIGMAPLPQPNGYLLATRSGDVYRTTNGGEYWEQIATQIGLLEKVFAADFSGNRFFAIPGPHSCDCILESDDGGRIWTETDGFGKEVVVSDMTDPRIHPFSIATSRGVFQETP